MQRTDTLNWRFTSLLKLIVLIQLSMNISILLDIMYVRQILGFVYLTFIPGILLLKALKMNNLTPARSVLFSMGLSISVLMLVGLFVNELYPFLGISQPLSITSLAVTMNLVTLLLCLVSYSRNKDTILTTSFSFPPLTFLFVSLPLLSLFGTFLFNTSQNNFVLLVMISMVPVSVILSIISKKRFPPNFYPLSLLCITIALLFHTSLITNYIVGWDEHVEYYVYRLTEKSSLWDVALTASGRYYTEILSSNSMLSVTVLPAVYSQILKLEGSFLFKILYPFIFAFTPLALYQLWRSQIGESIIGSLGIFLSAFFIISIGRFLRLVPFKEMVGELFFILLFLVLFDKNIDEEKRKILLVIFSAGLVVAHYSMAYLFLFLVLFTWLRSTPYFSSSLLMKRKLTLNFLVLFFVMTFSWYVYTSSSGTLTSFVVGYFDNIVRNFTSDFLKPEARGSKVLTGMGLTAAASFLHEIGRFFFYITEFLIVIGVARFILKRKEMKLDEDYVMLTGLNMMILLMCIVIPNFAAMFVMGRFYHVVLLFLAPMCILGGKTFFTFILKLKTEFSALLLILILVLTPLLLFETELVYTIAGDNSDVDSLALNMRVMDPVRLYNQITLEQEVLGARWLSTYVSVPHSLIVGDSISLYHVLTSYGMIPRDRMRILSNFTMAEYFNIRLERVDNQTYIYLRRLNIIDGIIFGGEPPKWNFTEISSTIETQNKIYSNGNCEIYNGLASPQP